jgi:hypothetical protein
MTREQLHEFVVPTFSPGDVQRMLIIGGCIATAAAANYGSTLPERVPVALGSALLGILLVLRRGPAPPVEQVAETFEPGPSEPEDSQAAAGATPRRFLRKASRQRLDARAQLLRIAASLDSNERRLEEHEARLVSLSGRQCLLLVDARELIAVVTERLQQIERRIGEAEKHAEAIRVLHLQLLRRLDESLAEHRQALLGLSDHGGEGDS